MQEHAGLGTTRWPRLRKVLRRLRTPGYRWVRIPIGVLLVLFGLVGFLPILGFWMIPLGLWLLAADIPAVRRLNKWLGHHLFRRRPRGQRAHHEGPSAGC
jgi:hypothetical protein